MLLEGLRFKSYSSDFRKAVLEAILFERDFIYSLKQLLILRMVFGSAAGLFL